jgi:small ligand-binding sensory domain FIST
MKLFPYAHATHPQWRMAAALVLAQLRAQMALPRYASSPTLGLLYISDHYAADAQDILDHLSADLYEVTDWSGTVGVGVASNNVEYFDEPAMVVMLCALPVGSYRVFSGVSPLGFGSAAGAAAGPSFAAHTALVHADAQTQELPELLTELSQRTGSGYLFGGLTSSRKDSPQFAFSHRGNLSGHGTRSVFEGGLSGVAFNTQVNILSRVTQGCAPVSVQRRITAAQGHVITGLDDEPALDVLLADLNINLDHPREALAVVRQTLVGLTQASAAKPSVAKTNAFGDEVLVRHIIGLDPGTRGIAVAQPVEPGMSLRFCRRNSQAAKADLIRICAEIREELESVNQSRELATELALDAPDAGPHPARNIAGAVYVSCAGRGGPHFGADSAELQIVRRALGDVPLVGFFAGGEVAGANLYGYTGVLTVFTTAPA